MPSNQSGQNTGASTVTDNRRAGRWRATFGVAGQRRPPVGEPRFGLVAGLSLAEPSRRGPREQFGTRTLGPRRWRYRPKIRCLEHSANPAGVYVNPAFALIPAPSDRSEVVPSAARTTPELAVCRVEIAKHTTGR